jgi:hypothetical protein
LNLDSPTLQQPTKTAELLTNSVQEHDHFGSLIDSLRTDGGNALLWRCFSGTQTISLASALGDRRLGDKGTIGDAYPQISRQENGDECQNKV